MDYIDQYLKEVRTICDKVDQKSINHIIDLLVKTRQQQGRLFFLGVGGSAANCSHAVNDFRKIAGFEAYTPNDNVSELTARINDEGWATVFKEWLVTSKLTENDALFIFSVGGGCTKNNISENLIHAIDYAKQKKAAVCAIVGRSDGYTAKNATACVVIPEVNKERLTPHAESFQAVLWHLIVSDPRIKQTVNKWESVQEVKL